MAGLDLAMSRAKALLDRSGIRFQLGMNESLAATSILGSQQVEAEGSAKHDGVFAFWYGKGPGVDWAGDAIKHGNAYGSSPHGGVLVIAGDDHGAVSSTMSHQSDQTLQSWYLPILHPATIEEYLELGLYGIALSRFSGAWVGFKAISRNSRERPPHHAAVSHAGLSFPGRFPDAGQRAALPLERSAECRHRGTDAGQDRGRRSFRPRQSRRPPRGRSGPGATGHRHGRQGASRSHGSVPPARLSTARKSKLSGVRIYKIAQTWPIERHGLMAAAAGLETLLVVEEKQPFVEDTIKSLLYGLDASKRPSVIGKTDERGERLLPAFGELRPGMLTTLLARRLRALCPGSTFPKRTRAHRRNRRLQAMCAGFPHFCSGCPHNSSTVVPEGSKAFGGIGCHIMATWMGRSTRGVTQMGGEGSNWIGLAPFVEREHMFQNLGDGTYFHSGSLGIRAALAAGSRITFKILFNDAVAMTGGQPHDGPLDPAKITRQVHEEGVRRIMVVSDDPEKFDKSTAWAPGVTVHHRRELDRLQRELAGYDGVSVLVYDQTCAAEKRRRRKKGTFADPARRVMINPLVCEACGDCSKTSNCLSIQPVSTEFGTKRKIDQSSCNKDFSCQDGFCPSFVTIEGGRLRKGRGLEGVEIEKRLASLPHPRLPAIEQVYEVLVTGIGGTGVLTVGAVIGMAAHLESRPVSVLDFTGLAQKGGAVLSHVRMAAKGEHLNQGRIEPGQADALIACDLVVAADGPALSTLKAGKTKIVCNLDTSATAGMIGNPSYRIDIDRLVATLKRQAGPSALTPLDAQKLALAATGD
ncbi:MAG: 2-oxoacid:acceptor oxidoreductase family protein, partial [Geminicoccaceae bacterium]